jgi:hypothetical protein
MVTAAKGVVLELRSETLDYTFAGNKLSQDNYPYFWCA